MNAINDRLSNCFAVAGENGFGDTGFETFTADIHLDLIADGDPHGQSRECDGFVESRGERAGGDFAIALGRDDF